MAKTNFDKVEEKLEKGLVDIKKKQLLDKADRQNIKKTIENEEEEENRKNLINSLRFDLKRLLKKDKNLSAELGIDEKTIAKSIDDPTSLSKEEWEKIKEIKHQVDKYVDEMLSPVEEDLNKEIIHFERSKHVNKRFNIRDGWLPLK